MKNKILRLFTTIGFGIGILLPLSPTSAWADSSDLTGLTAQWWQWVNSIPYENNPLNDPTGTNCMVGQRGSIWFLAGSGDATPVHRTCHIPRSVKLLVPVINVMVYNSPNVCGQGPESASVKFMRDLLHPLMDTVGHISVSIDGQRVRPIQRVQSDAFWIAFPANSYMDVVWCKDFGGQPAGIFGPGVDEGYYTVVGPLDPGTHVLNAHAESSALGTQDNTYTLIVE